MARVLDIAQTRPQDWIYLSEGGATIVFSYMGPSHPHFTAKVLRLRKTSLIATDDEDIAFYNTVFAALVPAEYLPDFHVVHLDAPWLATLQLLRNDDRPAERRARDRIDTARRKGILATDLIGGVNVLAIEIKPKWGFMPNPVHLSERTAKVKTSTCRFCMHTRFKCKKSAVPTQYCPLDLYSNDEVRMKKAIHDLWNGWMQSDGALNNMKLFVSGKMIRPSESYSSLEKFLSTKTDVHDALSIALLPLLRTPALRIISNLQRSLDALDIEGIIKLHAKACPESNGLGAIKQAPSLEEWQAFVRSYHSVYCTFDHTRLSPENMDTYLMAYVLSAAFKDCSLIFRIPRSGTSSVGPMVSIIDLDLKGMERMGKWAHLDRQIVQYYQDMGQHKSCIE